MTEIRRIPSKGSGIYSDLLLPLMVLLVVAGSTVVFDSLSVLRPVSLMSIAAIVLMVIYTVSALLQFSRIYRGVVRMELQCVEFEREVVRALKGVKFAHRETLVGITTGMVSGDADACGKRFFAAKQRLFERAMREFSKDEENLEEFFRDKKLVDLFGSIVSSKVLFYGANLIDKQWLRWFSGYKEGRVVGFSECLPRKDTCGYIGMLGTLLGIVVYIIPEMAQIDSGDQESIKGALIGLLNGLTVAFGTSFWGAVFTLIAASMSRAISSRFKEVLNRFDEVVSLLVLHFLDERDSSEPLIAVKSEVTNILAGIQNSLTTFSSSISDNQDAYENMAAQVSTLASGLQSTSHETLTVLSNEIDAFIAEKSPIRIMMSSLAASSSSFDDLKASVVELNGNFDLLLREVNVSGIFVEMSSVNRDLKRVVDALELSAREQQRLMLYLETMVPKRRRRERRSG